MDLANQGLDALEILRTYYGDDLELVEDAPIENLTESYPGVPLEPVSYTHLLGLCGECRQPGPAQDLRIPGSGVPGKDRSGCRWKMA